MANVADAVWPKAAAYAVRWLGVVALIVFNFGRAAAASARRWRSTWSSSASRLPAVGEQLLDPAVQLRRQAREDVLQVGPGFVPVELGRLQQAHDDSRPLAGQLTADEEPVFASEAPRPNSVLAVVVVDRHIAIEQEASEPGPVVQAVVDRLGDRAAVGHAAALELQPQMELFPQGFGSLLAHLQPLQAGQLPGVGLDSVQPGDALDRLGGDRAGVGLEEFVVVPSRVGDAQSRVATLEREHGVVASIGVDHQRAGPILEELGGVLAPAPETEVEDHSRLGLVGAA